MVSEDHSRGSLRQAAKTPRTQHLLYRSLADHYAVHDRPAGTPAPDAVLLLEDGAVAVFRGAPDDARQRGEQVGPVYRSAGGRLVVPTGRVLVRFDKGVSAASRRRDVEAAGYEIEEILPYAPEAAWVRRKGSDIREAIAGIDALQRLPGVESAAPQLLSRDARRANARRKSGRRS